MLESVTGLFSPSYRLAGHLASMAVSSRVRTSYEGKRPREVGTHKAGRDYEFRNYIWAEGSLQKGI